MTVIRMTELLGLAGLWLYIRKRLKKISLPATLPIFGNIRNIHEIRNIFDNFGTGQLRNRNIERYLSGEASPCIIDCGVNVGVTVRWWFHLNPDAKVYGIDMLKEAQEFTFEALKSIKIGRGSYKPVTAALYSENGKNFTVGVSDPLYGDYGFYRKDREETERAVSTKTLDTIAGEERIGEVDLLKIDLEGAAADALKGATELLKRTRYVVFEIHDVHNKEERGLASGILEVNGFSLIAATGRHLWWEKNA
jgi:FkbM family methyltransferase